MFDKENKVVVYQGRNLTHVGTIGSLESALKGIGFTDRQEDLTEHSDLFIPKEYRLTYTNPSDRDCEVVLESVPSSSFVQHYLSKRKFSKAAKLDLIVNGDDYCTNASCSARINSLISPDGRTYQIQLDNHIYIAIANSYGVNIHVDPAAPSVTASVDIPSETQLAFCVDRIKSARLLLDTIAEVMRAINQAVDIAEARRAIK